LRKIITLVPEMMAERAPYHLVTSIVAPRPIAWISTISADGTPNLAPFSFYSIVAGFPPTIMFSVSYRARKQPRQKDTLSNVMEVGEFVSHVVEEASAEAMAKTAVDYPPGVNEFEMAGLEVLPSIDVKPPRIAISPVAMECKVTQIIPVEQSTSIMVLGKIVRFHI
jgi:flavin reductase (DIM6/NTAB) family NADH-FMN oxidoreductase RutF